MDSDKEAAMKIEDPKTAFKNGKGKAIK